MAFVDDGRFKRRKKRGLEGPRKERPDGVDPDGCRLPPVEEPKVRMAIEGRPAGGALPAGGISGRSGAEKGSAEEEGRRPLSHPLGSPKQEGSGGEALPDDPEKGFNLRAMAQKRPGPRSG